MTDAESRQVNEWVQSIFDLIEEVDPAFFSRKSAQFSSGIRRSIIKSELIPVTPERFDEIEHTQPDVWDLLHRDSSDPSMKRFMYVNVAFGRRSGFTLANFISDVLVSGNEAYFSETSGLIHGVLLFEEHGDTIGDVAVFSLDSKVSFIRDLDRFIRSKIPTHNFSWVSHIDVPLFSYYEDLVEEYGGEKTQIGGFSNYYLFRIKKGSSSNRVKASFSFPMFNLPLREDASPYFCGVLLSSPRNEDFRGDGKTSMASGRFKRGIEKLNKPIFNSKEMLSGGVWISPSGDIFGVPLTHIKAVIEDPVKFGLSVGQLKVIYNKHNEGIGSEGDARDEVISLLISQGWIRIRFYPGEYYHIELNRLTQNCKDVLFEWASRVLTKYPEKESLPVVICERQNNNLETSFMLGDLLDKTVFVGFNKTRWEAKDLIESATIQDLLTENDRNPEFTHRQDHLAATKAQGDSEITRCYASTVELRTKSEHFKENQTYYRQWVLFKDFISIAKDKKIKFEDAIDYAINFCDVNIRCSCPYQLYFGISYMGDQLGYLYGLPREKRFPKIRNPNLKLATCKHVDIALEHLEKNKEKLIQMFGKYYKRLEETPPDTMIAIPAKAVEEKEEESIEDFLAGFDEDGNEIDLPEGKEEIKEDEVETISEQDPETGAIKIDTKLAEGSLPLDQQVKYAGEEDKPVDEDVVENVADSVTEEEEEELATQIDEASFNDGSPKNDNEKFVNEWSFQRFKPKSYTHLDSTGRRRIISSYSLFGDFEPFSEVVRRIVPKELVGDPTFLGVSEDGTLGRISFEYFMDEEKVWLAFTWSLSGSGLVTICDGVEQFMRYSSLEELGLLFPFWYFGL